MMKSFKQIRPKKPSEAQAKEKYRILFQQYVEQQFTYNNQQLIRKISQNGRQQPHLFNLPLKSILTQVVKCMMMNELQILFLGSTLQEMKWKVDQACLDQYMRQVKDITPSIPKDSFTSKVQFAFLLIALIVKNYLNEDNSIFDIRIRQIVRNNFDKMYQSWVQKVKSYFKFNPKSMNKLFKQYDYPEIQSDNDIVDYNKLVSDYFYREGTQDQKIEEEYVQPEYRQTQYKHPKIQNQEPPMDEVPQQYNYRTSSNYLLRRTSNFDLSRRQSGNQFLNSSQNGKTALGFNLIRNNSSVSRDN